jgi:HAE1 family hydrophobic/amphiphilic exporter-1
MKRIVTISNWRRRLFFITAFLLIISLGTIPFTAALGEEKEIQILTLEEALLITVEKNRDIQKAREYRNQVEGRYVEERAAALPQLVITAHASNTRDESQKAFGEGFPLRNNTRSAELGLSQALFTWGQIGAAVRAAKVGIATADDQLRIFRQAAFQDVSASFYDILLAKALNTLAIQNLEQKTRHYDEARKKYSAGVATDYDVLVAKVAVGNARPDVIRTENLIRISREKLRFLLGNPQEVDIKGSLEATIATYPKYEDAVEVAMKNRPELSDLRHRIDVAIELVKIANAGDKPRLDFKAGYGFRDLDVGMDHHANGSAWSAGLFVTYPIFDGLRTRGKVSQAKSNVATLKIEEAKSLDSIKLEVRDACNAMKESGEIVRALSGTVGQAERLLYMAEKGYEYGVKIRLDVEDAELNLIQAKGNLARAKRDYLVSCVNLERVTGRLGEKEEALQSKAPESKIKNPAHRTGFLDTIPNNISHVH